MDEDGFTIAADQGRKTMSLRSDQALHALALVVRERRGRLILLREHSTDYVVRKDADAILKALDEVEAAWAENDRKG
jgi:hypothetical protein